MSEVIVTQNLSHEQLTQVTELINICKKEDSTNGVFYLDNEENELQIPSFFLLYEQEQLISALSIFFVNKEECEIYAVTLPSYRKKGCFSKLLDKAMKFLDEYEVETIFFVCETESSVGKIVLEQMGAEFVCSEYLFIYNPKEIVKPKRNLELNIIENGNEIRFETYLKDTLIGTICAEIFSETVCIYNVEVSETYRNRHYGTETLLLTLEYLQNKGYQNMMLHVNSLNVAAVALYTKHGFEVKQELEYWVWE